MAGLTISIKRTTDLGARMKAIPKALQSAQVTTMQRAVAMTERELRKTMRGTKGSDPFWGVTGAAGDTLGSRSGHTLRSLATSVYSVPQMVVGTVGSPLPQMKLHEEGGTVSGHPYLRIPTRVMQRPNSGTDKLTGQRNIRLPNTFIFKSNAGKLWIAETGTSRARLAAELNGYPLLLYLLVPSVTLRARHLFSGTLARVRPKLHELFGGMFTAVVEGK